MFIFVWRIEERRQLLTRAKRGQQRDILVRPTLKRIKESGSKSEPPQPLRRLSFRSTPAVPLVRHLLKIGSS
jgi:hypothetical protein